MSARLSRAVQWRGVQVCVGADARSREMQAWGGGRSIVSEADRREIKRAKKEGRLAEAMLDRRAALKRSVPPYPDAA